MNADRQPSELFRAKSAFVGMAMLILAIGPSELVSPTWWRTSTLSEWVAVAVGAVAGSGLAILGGRNMWRMAPESPSDATVLRQISTAMVVVAFLLALRESGMWPWPLAAADAFVSALCLVLAATASITERNNRGRVYIARRGYVLVQSAREA